MWAWRLSNRLRPLVFDDIDPMPRRWRFHVQGGIRIHLLRRQLSKSRPYLPKQSIADNRFTKYKEIGFHYMKLHGSRPPWDFGSEFWAFSCSCWSNLCYKACLGPHSSRPPNAWWDVGGGIHVVKNHDIGPSGSYAGILPRVFFQRWSVPGVGRGENDERGYPHQDHLVFSMRCG